jgi:hypothetical protein
MNKMINIPTYYLTIFISSGIFSMLSWEIWVSHGIYNGDSVVSRGGNIPNWLNTIIMSALDGLICAIIVWICIKRYGVNMFKKWNWNGFLFLFMIANVQNIIAFILVNNVIKNKTISLAPLAPIRSNAYIQLQEPWIILPVILYTTILYTGIIK